MTAPSPAIAFVVARTLGDNLIGIDNAMPWHLRTDLKRFKAITGGHVVLMGRKTNESIGRPLPGRTSIVVSRAPGVAVENGATRVLWASSPDEALALAREVSAAPEIFVIGGAEMFAAFAPLCDSVHLTEIEMTAPQGATARFFPMPFPEEEWRVEAEEYVPAGPQDDHPTRYRYLRRRA